MYLKVLFFIWFNCEIIKGAPINFDGDIDFLLYTKNFQKYPQQLFLDDNETLSLSDFKAIRNTIILIHEWGTGMRSIHITPIKLALLNIQDLNIIIINWYNEALLTYSVARKLVSAIGQYIGRFIQFLSSSKNSKLSQFYIITYGLGAHIAGNIGIKVNRIVALNPQNELFTMKDTDKLNPNSAICVETFFSTLNETSKYYLHDLSKRNIFILEENNIEINLGEYYAYGILNKTIKGIKCGNLTLFKNSNCMHNKQITVGNPFAECSEGNYYSQLQTD